MRYAILSLCTVLILCSGCARHTVNTQPEPLFDMPEAFSSSVDAAAPQTGTWWAIFQDDALNQLVEQALSDNLTLQQGLNRIDRAAALLWQAEAVRKPQLDLDADLQRQWQRDIGSRPDSFTTSGTEKTIATLDAVNDVATALAALAANQPLSVSPSSTASTSYDRSSSETQYGAGLRMRWEADLWGRLAAARDARLEDWQAQVQDYEALRLMLSAKLVDTYFLIIEQHLQQQLLMEQKNLAQTYLDLLQLRFLQGNASGVDLLQQKSQLAEIDSEIPRVIAQLGALENRLDVLLGAPADGQARVRNSSAILPEHTALPALDVPVALLQQRPDLQASQRRVIAADHHIAVAMADRLPQLTLNGGLLFNENGSSILTGLGSAALFQPLLDWGFRKAQVDIQRSDFKTALLAYSQHYLIAIEEVETALWQEQQQRVLIESLIAREEILQRTVEETRARYSLGVTDYLPVLNALQNLHRVQRTLLRERRTLVELRIQLYRATGGATRSEDQLIVEATQQAEAN